MVILDEAYLDEAYMGYGQYAEPKISKKCYQAPCIAAGGYHSSIIKTYGFKAWTPTWGKRKKYEADRAIAKRKLDRIIGEASAIKARASAIGNFEIGAKAEKIVDAATKGKNPAMCPMAYSKPQYIPYMNAARRAGRIFASVKCYKSLEPALKLLAREIGPAEQAAKAKLEAERKAAFAAFQKESEVARQQAIEEMQRKIAAETEAALAQSRAQLAAAQSKALQQKALVARAAGPQAAAAVRYPTSVQMRAGFDSKSILLLGAGMLAILGVVIIVRRKRK